MQQLRFYSPQWLYSTSKAIAEKKKNAIFASCWTYFTTIRLVLLYILLASASWLGTKYLDSWCSCDRTLLEQRCKQPTRCNNFSFINLLNSALHVSGDKFAHPQEHFFDCTNIYSFWYNAPTLLPTGATVEMERQFHLNRGTVRQQCRCIVPKAVYIRTVKKVLLRMGEFVSRNM